MGGLTLLPEEVTLVATLDGPTTLEEICRSARTPDFALCRTVWGLWAAGVLDRVPQDLPACPSGKEKTEPHAGLVGASIGREIHDRKTKGLFSFADLVWDALGAGAALLIINKTQK